LASGASMRAEAVRRGGGLGARLPAPRRRRSGERRRLVSSRRPPALDRTVAGGMGDDRAGAAGLDQRHSLSRTIQTGTSSRIAALLRHTAVAAQVPLSEGQQLLTLRKKICLYEPRNSFRFYYPYFI